ncbi:MAG: hypothetical protein IGS54_08810 [Elainella sp. C42_A2020_010]|nr:hypothetical protein [Elainella sp. C42_A2020_010]
MECCSAAQRHLRLIVDHQPNGYQVRVVLSLPTRTLVAQSKSRFESYQAAMDEVAEILAEEIRRYKGQLRRDRSHRRRQQRRKDFATVTQLLEQDTAGVSASRRDRFRVSLMLEKRVNRLPVVDGTGKLKRIRLVPFGISSIITMHHNLCSTTNTSIFSIIFLTSVLIGLH